jgi:hypothetical protein
MIVCDNQAALVLIKDPDNKKQGQTCLPQNIISFKLHMNLDYLNLSTLTQRSNLLMYL